MAYCRFIVRTISETANALFVSLIVTDGVFFVFYGLNCIPDAVCSSISAACGYAFRLRYFLCW